MPMEMPFVKELLIPELSLVDFIRIESFGYRFSPQTINGMLLRRFLVS